MAYADSQGDEVGEDLCELEGWCFLDLGRHVVISWDGIIVEV
jgi:hypothetical protein